MFFGDKNDQIKFYRTNSIYKLNLTFQTLTL